MSDPGFRLSDEPALRGTAFPPRLPGEDAKTGAGAARDLADEPALRGLTAADGVGAGEPHGVWGEPALAGTAAADRSRERHAAWVAAQWAAACGVHRAGVFLALALASGPFAVLCAIAREAAPSVAPVLATAVMAPVAEELAKIAAPLMMLEKRPWNFSSGGSVTALCALSGLVFACIENVMYFFVYLDAPTPGLVAWRLVVCTALHVVCAGVSGAGLGRAWKRAEANRSAADPAPAAPWIIAAMLVHGAYNALATVVAFF